MKLFDPLPFKRLYSISKERVTIDQWVLYHFRKVASP